MKSQTPRRFLAPPCVAMSILAAAAPAHAGLLAHWKFDETTGTTAADASGNGLTATGAGNWTTGVSGNAALNPSFTLSDSSSLALADGNTAFTISLWVKTTTDDDFANIAGFEGTGSNGDRYSIKVSGGNIQATPGGATASGKIATLSNDTWIHIVAVNDPTAGNSKMYVNGVQSGSDGSVINLSSTTSEWTIGTYWNSNSYNYTGAMDDVQVYDQALTGTEVASLFANPGFDLFTIPSGAVVMGPPSADTPTDDGATVEATLLGADATDVTVVWAYDDQGESTIGTWTGAGGGGSHSFGATSENDLLSHAISGLDGDTEYNFRFFATGTSSTDWSAPGTFITGLASEPAPAGLAAIAGATLLATKVDLSWTDGFDHETGFLIQRSTDPGFGGTPDEFSVGADETSYTDTTTDGNTTYHYRIAATGITGNGAFSAGVEVTTGDDPELGLIAHWTFDEAGDVDAADSSASGYDLTRVGGTTVAGISGNAYSTPRFFMNDSGQNDELKLVGGSVTVSVWVKDYDGGGFEGIVGYETTGGFSGDIWSIKANSPNPSWTYDGGAAISAPLSLADYQAASTNGGWVQIVGVYDWDAGAGSGTATLYIDGNPVATTTGSNALPSKPTTFNVGSYDEGSSQFSGSIDDVQVYSSALTSTEVSFLFNNPGSVVGGTPSSPFDDWAAGFLPTDVSDPAGNGDGDSLTNLLEFAFGTDPTVSDGTSLVWNDPGFDPGTPIVAHSFPGGGVDFKARFIRRVDHGAPGSADYALRFSSDLTDWESSSDVSAPGWWVPGDLAVLETDGNYELVEYPYPFFLDGGPKARFFQVEVTEVP